MDRFQWIANWVPQEAQEAQEAQEESSDSWTRTHRAQKRYRLEV